MSETSVPATTDDTKPCRVCGEAIKKVARVCIHCNNYQDWRADISVSNTLLALLVALVSVLTAAIPVVVKVMTPNNSDIIFSFQAADDDILSILATNKGVRPGSVGSYAMIEMNEATKGFLGPLLREDPPSDIHIIRPGDSILQRFTYTADASDKKLLSGDKILIGKNSNCTLLFDTTDFIGNVSHSRVGIQCDQLRFFIKKIGDKLLKLPKDPPS